MDPAKANKASMTSGSSRFLAAVLLLMLGVGMVVSDPYFTFIDDEVQIISAAANPVAETVDLFIHGTGQFEHPPLYDLLLHGWEWITGSQMGLLRLLSIGFYLLGIWILVETARELNGNHAARAVLWVSVLWPFGFHFGRLAAWYSLSFLLVAILTYTYLAFLKARSLKNWLLLVIPAILLLYTNYFGWAILACLLLDYLLQAHNELRQHGSKVLVTLLFLAIAFLPLVRAFASVIAEAAGSKASLPGMALFEAFNIYALFASESVAPWHWALGVPVCVAITVCVAAVWFYAPPVARRLFVHFLLLITGMSVLGIVGTKRLLMISAWVILPVGLSLGTVHLRRAKACLLASLLVIAGIGWYGTVSRRYYAAPRFIEPWNDVAKQMANVVRDGGVVIASHPSFFSILITNYIAKRREASWTWQAHIHTRGCGHGFMMVWTSCKLPDWLAPTYFWSKTCPLETKPVMPKCISKIAAFWRMTSDYSPTQASVSRSVFFPEFHARVIESKFATTTVPRQLTINPKRS
jgi:hypothetical protein